MSIGKYKRSRLQIFSRVFSCLLKKSTYHNEARNFIVIAGLSTNHDCT